MNNRPTDFRRDFFRDQHILVGKLLEFNNGLCKVEWGKDENGESRISDRIPIIFPYGFSAWPEAIGCNVVVACINGSREAMIALALMSNKWLDRSKKNGEVEVGTVEGDRIIFKNGNKVHLFSKQEITIEAPNVKVKSNEVIIDADKVSVLSGTIELGKKVFKKLVNEGFLKHIHDVTVDTNTGKGTASPVLNTDGCVTETVGAE